MTREEMQRIVDAARTPAELLAAAEQLVAYARQVHRAAVRQLALVGGLMVGMVAVAIVLRYLGWAPVCP